jgi:hypothetical protein
LLDLQEEELDMPAALLKGANGGAGRVNWLVQMTQASSTKMNTTWRAIEPAATSAVIF